MALHLIHGELTESVIGAFYNVYNTRGFGLLEHVYMMALERELTARGHRVAREASVVVRYKGEQLAQQRIDMIVDERLIVEIKSTYELHKATSRQLFSYLRATNLEVALLLHFGPRPDFFRLVSTNKQHASSLRFASSSRNLAGQSLGAE